MEAGEEIGKNVHSTTLKHLTVQLTFWQFVSKAYNLYLECLILKLKCAFSSSLKGLSNFVFRF